MNPNIVPIHGTQEDSINLTAEVKTLSKDVLILVCGGSVISARKAFSCLIAPMVGDRVMVSMAEGEYFVLAILERPDQKAMTLEFPASVQMNIKAGGFGVAARDNIDLLTTASSNLMAKELNMSSSSMKLHTGKLTSHTQEIDAHSRRVQLFTGLLNTVAEQVTQRAGMVVRWVENVETLNVGNLIQKIRHNHTSHAGQAVITAKSDMRIDAERIHMG